MQYVNIYQVYYNMKEKTGLKNTFYNFMHPFVSGLFGFTATIIGANFFTSNSGIEWILIGIFLYIMVNHLMLKFTFNSYQLNGATITTSITFLSQLIWMTIYKSN